MWLLLKYPIIILDKRPVEFNLFDFINNLKK